MSNSISAWILLALSEPHGLGFCGAHSGTVFRSFPRCAVCGSPSGGGSDGCARNSHWQAPSEAGSEESVSSLPI